MLLNVGREDDLLPGSKPTPDFPTAVSLMAVGVALVSKQTGMVGPSDGPGVVAQTQENTQAVPDTPGTAVGDLQALDNNDDLYANFDVLDDLQVQEDVTATP